MIRRSISSLIFGATMLSGLSAQAHAEYLRFWRGEMRDDISSASFIDGLNHGLFPATGELAKGPSKLLSYQPVIASTDALKSALPEEVALLQYESEATYKAFRQTPEGIHYGDLHWNYFKKDLSKSLVVESWLGSAALEKAYSIGAVGQVWNHGITTYRAYIRNSDLPDDQYLTLVSRYLDQLKADGKTNAVLLIAKDYVLEYLNAPQGEGQSQGFTKLLAIQSTELSRSKSVNESVLGLTYPVYESTENRGVRATWNHHIDAWKHKDLEQIIADYDHDSVVILNDEIYRGQTQIRKVFTKLFNAFDKVLDSKIYRVTMERGSVYLLWNAKVLRDVETTYSGTDTFVIEKGRIKLQTITVDEAFLR